MDKNKTRWCLAAYDTDGTLLGGLKRTTTNEFTFSGTVESTSMDSRILTSPTEIINASNIIKQLEPKAEGFVADTLQTAVPTAVTGTQNETEATGTLADYDGTVLETAVVEPPAEELTYTEEVVATPYVATVAATYDEDGEEVTAETPEVEATYTTVTRTRTWTATGTQPVYQGVDQTKLIPLLTKALQEALERIEALELT